MKPQYEQPKARTNPSDFPHDELPKRYEESFNGHYIGIVESNTDEEKKCRLKVRVPEVHGAIPTEHLPWAMVSTGGYSSKTEETRHVIVGIAVLVVFVGGNPYFPVVVGRMPSMDGVGAEARKDYPKTSVLWSANDGSRVTYNDASGLMSVTHASGTAIDITKDGDVNISSVGAVNVKANTAVVESVESVSVNAPAITIGSDTHVVTPSATGGGLNCLPKCLFTGAPHSGSKMTGA